MHTLLMQTYKGKIIFAFATLSLILAGSSRALCNQISFNFSGNVDASQFGLSMSTPVSIYYSYDPGEAPFPGSNASYPLDFAVTVGGYNVAAHGALNIVIQPTYDQYELSAAGNVVYYPGYNGQLMGAINGITPFGVDLDIVNDSPPIDMFSSTSLPTSTQFVAHANVVQLEIQNFNETATILKRFGPADFTFSAQAVPEPSSGALLLLSPLAFGFTRLRKQFIKRG